MKKPYTRITIMPQENKLVENSAMSAQEARQCLAEIQTHLTSVRLLLVDLDKRRGWEALGYKSMRQCLKTELKGKTGKSLSQLYRELNAGKIEQELSHNATTLEMGTIPERHLEPLNQLPPEQWHLAWQTINETAPSSGVTRAHVLQIVAKIKGTNSSPYSESYHGNKDNLATSQASTKTTTRFIPLRESKTGEENSFYKPSDMVVIACGADVPLEWRRWNGYWGVVRSIGHSAGSVEVVVRGFPVRYKPSDLEPIDNPDSDFKLAAERINQLLQRSDLDEAERYLLETWYCKRSTFSNRQLKVIDDMTEYYENESK